eukprot:scaffold8495_cov80-Skeletonema_dohrnii-CCMP3373.AAC.1
MLKCFWRRASPSSSSSRLGEGEASIMLKHFDQNFGQEKRWYGHLCGFDSTPVHSHSHEFLRGSTESRQKTTSPYQPPRDKSLNCSHRAK